MARAPGCETRNRTGYVPTSIDSTSCSDFVECPYCGDDTEFKNKMGWSPKEPNQCK